jgi:superfamily II DNA helicase RecQ
VVASAALSMGVNFPDIRNVVNWGPPRNLLDLHQEAGRAGRDNIQGHIFIPYHGQQLSQCEESVKLFVRCEESCLRVAAYIELDKAIQPLQPSHDCCSFCTKKCKCNGELGCDYICPSFEFDNSKDKDICTHMLSRPVTESDKDDLQEALNEIQSGMASSTVLDTVSTHGFSSQLINDVVKNCSILFTVHDILETCPVFSLSHAIQILELIQEMFLDIPNFDESMNMLANGNTCLDELKSLQQVLQEIGNDEQYTDIPDDDEFDELDELPEVWT